MLNIGQFAQLTGLTVKALRLYDKHGFLNPAEVDPWSGYRRYAAAQLPTAVRMKALRAADVSLADAARALHDETGFETVLSEHRAKLAKERDRQDAAMVALDAQLADTGRTWDVQERHADTQDWVGVVIPLADDVDEEVGTDAVNVAFAALWQALSNEGNSPTGPFWWSMLPGDDVTMLACWPVEHPVSKDWSLPGWQVESGRLPSRMELVVRWRLDEAPAFVDETVHPAYAALLIDAERRDIDVDLTRVRQLGWFENGESVGFEITYPFENRGTGTHSLSS